MIRIAIAVELIVLVTGCANLPPSIEPLFAEVDNQRVRWIEPGTVVTVRAVASDPDRDRLQYRWTTGRDSGSVVVNGLPEARWNVGDSPAFKVLHVSVMDGRGGVAKASSEVSTGPGMVHSGVIYGPDGNPIPGAEVDINGKTTRTNEKGGYTIEFTGDAANANRYVMNVHNAGYADFSRVLGDGVVDGSWTLTRATAQSANPANPIAVTDTNAASNCRLPYSARIDWDAYLNLRVPRSASSTGQLVNATVNGRLNGAIEYVLEGGHCNPGASVAIPANALVDFSGNPPTGDVDISLATVNLTTPNAMPGDWQVRGTDEAGFMESYGAADIKVSADGRQYKLKRGESATLTIPVVGRGSVLLGDDGSARKLGDIAIVSRSSVPPGNHDSARKLPEIPAEVPLLLYDESSGSWKHQGVARRNATRTAYVAEVDHFSAYNVDLVKTDPACLRIDSQAVAGSFDLDIIVATSGTPTYRNRSINNAPGDQQHAILNLPPNDQIALIPMRVTPNPSCPQQPDVAPIGVFIGTSGNAIPGGRLQTQDFSPPYDECGPWAALIDTGSTAQIQVDGTGQLVGPWPAHFYALADPANDEIYPLGAPATCNFYSGSDTSCSLIGIVDTGSIRLLLQETMPNALTGTSFPASDASLLGLTGNMTVDLRLNGLARRDASGVPEDSPGGARPPEIQISNINAQLGSSFNAGPTNLTVIGTNVLRNLVTLIDNANSPANIPEITHINGIAGVRFFNPGDPALPTPQVTLSLEGWPMTGPQPPRYLIENMRWQEGCAMADDTPDTNPTPLQFLLDSGTPFTVIGDGLANALNLTAPGDTDCFSAGDGLAHDIDKITMAGTGGTYTITNARVCWDPSVISTNIKGRLADAVVGANFFSQVAVLLDGPSSTLGVSVP